MQYVLEHLGVAVGAVTGVLAARGKHVDLFGVLVIALATAFGGGTVRDLMIGASPVFWAKDAAFLLNGAATAVLMFYSVRFHEPPLRVLLVADAFVLAFFTILGTRKSLIYGMSPSVAIAMGVTTGVAGGIVRDVLVREMPIVFRRETYFYATAAFVGACVYVVARHFEMSAQSAMIIGAGSILAMRLAGIMWRLTLPLFEEKEDPAEQ